jgi:hypothetical protein
MRLLSEKQLDEFLSGIKTPKLERKKKPAEPEPPRDDAVVISPNWDRKPTEAVIQEATRGNQALAERMTAEDRCRRHEAKELAEWNDPRARHQRELDRWWQSKLDAEAALDDGYDYSTGFKERKRKMTCHRGPGDPDWGL